MPPHLQRPSKPRLNPTETRGSHNCSRGSLEADVLAGKMAFFCGEAWQVKMEETRL